MALQLEPLLGAHRFGGYIDDDIPQQAHLAGQAISRAELGRLQDVTFVRRRSRYVPADDSHAATLAQPRSAADRQQAEARLARRVKHRRVAWRRHTSPERLELDGPVFCSQTAIRHGLAGTCTGS